MMPNAIAALILRASTAAAEPIASVSIWDEWSSDLVQLKIIRRDAQDRKVDIENPTYLYACA
jgi:hypothetical protein